MAGGDSNGQHKNGEIVDEKPRFTGDEPQLPVYQTDKELAGIPPSVPIYNEVELVNAPDLSFGSILKGSAATPLTLFEKKAALVNASVFTIGWMMSVD